MKNNRLSNQQGFSLIEAIIAMVILAIGLLTLITMQTAGIRGNAKSNSITEYSVHAADSIEQIFSWPYNSLVDAQAVGDPNHGEGGLNTIGANADYTFPKDPVDPEPYTIYVNVAENMVMLNSKSIRIIVVNDGVGVNVAAPVKMDYTKLALM